MSVYVIVDESDSRLAYSPTSGSGLQPSDESLESLQGWCIACQDGIFLHTSTRSSKPLSTMSYEFNGSSIQVFGNINSPGDSDTTVSFEIDGNVQASPTFSAETGLHHNYPLFVSPPLDGNTTHLLTMTILGSNSFSLTHPADLFLDYLIYEATINSTIPPSDAGNQTSWIFVDDTSSYLEYSHGGWESNPVDYTDLLHNSSIFNASTTQPLGQNATVSLNFTGVSTIVAHGAIVSPVTSSGGLGWFSIDDGVNNLLSSAPSNGSTYPSENCQLFTTSVDSTSGVTHKLTITASGSNSFELDYILLESTNAFIKHVDGENAPSPTTGPGTTPSSGSHGGEKGLDVGALAGGVVGGVILLTVAVVALLHRLRRRREYGSHRRGPFNDLPAHTSTYIDEGRREPERSTIHLTSMSGRFVTPTESGYTYTADPFLITSAGPPHRPSKTNNPIQVAEYLPTDMQPVAREAGGSESNIRGYQTEGSISQPPPYTEG